MKQPAKHPVADASSWSELARRLNRSRQVLQRRVNDGRWPAGVATAPPWSESDVQRLVQHQSRLPPDAAQPAVPASAIGDALETAGLGNELATLSLHARAKLKLIAERAAWIELQRKIASGDYMLREEVERGRVRRVYAVKAELLALPRAIAADFAPEIAARIEAIAKERVIDMLERFANGPESDEADEP